MGKMRFGKSQANDPIINVQEMLEESKLGKGLVKGLQEMVEAEAANPKIVYVDRPVEVIREITKTIEVTKEVPVEVIREVQIEKPVIVEKVVLVEAATPPAQIVEKEIIVEKVVTEKEQLNLILIYALALSLLANVIQGLF